MPLKFTQTFEDLKAVLISLDSTGEWVGLNQNQKQFRQASGAIMNWFLSTGTINFQGKSAAAVELEKTVAALLNQKPAEPLPSVLVNGPENKIYSTDSRQATIHEPSSLFLGNQYSDSELVIALIGAVGTELNRIESIISDRLKIYNYSCESIHISTDIISELIVFTQNYTNEYERYSKLMDYGNEVRRKSDDNSALALGAAAKISQMRLAESGGYEPAARRRKAYIINSLKHPAEVQRLREVYTHGFFAIGVYADVKRRYNYLVTERRMSNEQAQELIERDADETLSYGQHTSDTFHLSDFFIHYDKGIEELDPLGWRPS